MDEKPVNEEMIRGLDAKLSALTPVRDKRWDECGIEEKVERLRQELRGFRWWRDQVERRTQHFEEHQHDAFGNIVIPLRSKHGYGMEASSRDLLA
jgi:hypothetical protein